MNNQLSLPHPREAQRLAQSWTLSAVLHGLAVGLAVALLGDLRLVPEPEPFKWEVSMVDAEAPQTAAEPSPAAPAPKKAQQPLKPAPQPAKTEVVPPPQTLVASVAPPPPVVHQQVVQPPPEEIKPEIKKELPEPEVRKEPPPPPVVPSTPVMTHSQPAVEVPKPAPEPKTVEAPPLQAAPAPPQSTQPLQPTQHTMVASAAPSHASVQTPVMEAPPTKEAAPAPATPVDPAPAPIQEAAVRGPSSPPVAHSGPPAKADFGWVGKMLWDRVVTLKRYPHLARMQHMEGRVVVRAVIRDDGHLMDARVTESSGYEVLDQDAIEVLKRATPLKLHQPLGRPEVVVQVPITYRLQR